MEGTIPSEICYSTSLESFLWDGLSSSSSCTNKFFSKIHTSKTYYLSNKRLHGTIPVCLFNMSTIASLHLGANGQTDRIASNIITGIGFIGAGIIFKNELSVSGLTTAATIWIAAALGMLVGNDEFLLAFVAFALVMLVLSVFDRLKYFVDVIHQERTYKMIFDLNRTNSSQLEEMCKAAGLRVKKIKEYRSESIVSVYLQVSGSLEKQMRLNQQLLESSAIKAFEY
jgi:putative Mg2+ transporter-C (MgtC) family protein